MCIRDSSPSVSEKTRYSVQRAMEVLNYQPNANAQALAVQNTDTIGVVVTDVTDPFFAILVDVYKRQQQNLAIIDRT